MILTPNQQALLIAIREETVKLGLPPTITHMARHYQIRVPSMWERYEALIAKGALRRTEHGIVPAALPDATCPLCLRLIP